MREGRRRAEVVVASIFVNPTQFAPNEDFGRYPRAFERDCELMKDVPVDIVFAPEPDAMYPAGAQTWVEATEITRGLCGAHRPGHFRGVTTVVAKLFHIVEPDAAFFGQKDAAQVAIIRRMVRDLNLAVKIVVCPIVREADGLAMSSRNAYLDSEHRKRALVLHRALIGVQGLAEAGERDASKLLAAGREAVAMENALRLDYLEIVNPDTLDPVKHVSGSVLVAVAAYVGGTRLIDNILLDIAPPATTLPAK